MGQYIICYDIRHPRRLGRIHRFMRKFATALQYSVFLFTGTARQLQQHMAELESLMDKREDDIRSYPIPEHGVRLCLGQGILPMGIHWSSLPVPSPPMATDLH